MRVSDYFGAVVLFAALLLAPGFPLGLHLVRRRLLPGEMYALALSPILSILSNFGVLFVANIFGIRPSLLLVGLANLVFGLVLLARLKSFERASGWTEFASCFTRVLPAIVTALLTWVVSFRGFLFVAPNDDSFRHNLWIARMIDTNSVLGSDVLVDSPLQNLGSVAGKYPLAWHAFVATWAEITRVPGPILSLVSVFILWAIFMPMGLRVLAERWAPSLPALGVTAGVVSQLVPLVPGEPLTWGAMTSPVGISLLPAMAALLGYSILQGSGRHKVVSVLLIGCLVAIHTPEAATAIVFVVTFSLSAFVTRGFRVLAPLFAVVLVAAGVGLIVYRDFLTGGLDGLRNLWGATSPGVSWSFGTFLSMSVNSVGDGLPLAILFIIGIATGVRVGLNAESYLTLGGIAFVFYLSGAADSVFGRFRFLTSPWYASYERTLWVAVPFAALFVATPIAALWSVRSSFPSVRLSGMALASLASVWLASTQIRDTIGQFREGPRMWSVVGVEDRRLFERISRDINDDELVLSFGADGGSYLYMFNGVPVTAGQPFGLDGSTDDFISTFYANILQLCSVKSELSDGGASEVALVLFGSRLNPWGTPGFNVEQVVSIEGLELVDQGEFVVAAKPAFEKCS